MFSFHKPRVYRSTEGCCICRAKSSSSRFTDSKKYEDDSVQCFNLDQPRQGEICNACVLLVKRFKRLPTECNRHWGHVVDARVGPGIKSMVKFRKLMGETQQQQSAVSDKVQKITSSSMPEKFSKIFRKTKKSNTKNLKTDKKRGEGMPKLWDEQSLPPTPESFNSDIDDQMQFGKNGANRLNRRKILKPKKYVSMNMENVSFIDDNLWKYLKVCCGFAYENAHIGALIIDIHNFKPCSEHRFSTQLIPPNITSSTIQKTDFKYLPNKQNVNLKSIQFSTNTTVNNLNAENTFPVLKKHHLFFKHQQDIVPVNNSIISNQINTGTFGSNVDTQFESINKNKNSIMHKIKSADTAGKIMKHSINKINATGRLKHQDIIDVGTIVKSNEITNLISIKKIDGKIITQNKKYNGPPTNNTKFSDNSSDSGFDENLLDRKSTSPIQEDDNRGQKYLNMPVKKMFLANGIQIQGQQENLILTGNEVTASFLKSRRLQQHI